MASRFLAAEEKMHRQVHGEVAEGRHEQVRGEVPERVREKA